MFRICKIINNYDSFKWRVPYDKADVFNIYGKTQYICDNSKDFHWEQSNIVTHLWSAVKLVLHGEKLFIGETNF